MSTSLLVLLVVALVVAFLCLASASKDYDEDNGRTIPSRIADPDYYRRPQ
jgi:hypothetical protein